VSLTQNKKKERRVEKYENEKKSQPRDMNYAFVVFINNPKAEMNFTGVYIITNNNKIYIRNDNNS
jgi:hypothetical protein